MRTYPDTSAPADSTLAHRRGRTAVTVTDPGGQPLADAQVTVEMVRHQFGFGCIGFEFTPLATGEAAGEDRERLEVRAQQWHDVFNWTTLPFYWGSFEPTRGEPRTDALRATAEWFAERRTRIKGHPLVWHTLCAPWLADLPVEEIERAQRARIQRDVAGFKGLIDMWDAINEVVIMPVFDKERNGITRLARRIGRLGITRLAFDEARAANPDATLLLNDFDMSPAYDTLLEGVLEAGIRVDELGLQSHMHQGYWGEERTLATIDKFARYGLPIHFTETTLLSGDLMPPEIDDLNDHVVDQWPSTPEGEQRQADDVERHFRTLFAHPAVVSATYWGLSDDDMWLGAPGGLLRVDGTPKPSYDRLRALVRKEWWTPTRVLRTGPDGVVDVDGWLRRLPRLVLWRFGRVRARSGR